MYRIIVFPLLREEHARWRALLYQARILPGEGVIAHYEISMLLRSAMISHFGKQNPVL
jgi:hypothetical protein